MTTPDQLPHGPLPVPDAAEVVSSPEPSPEAVLDLAVTQVFTDNPDQVVTAEDGSQQLTLYMPYKPSSSRRGTEVATLSFSRTESADGSITDMKFSSKGAWDSRARLTTDTTTGEATLVDLARDRPEPPAGSSILDRLKAYEEEKKGPELPLVPSTEGKDRQFNKAPMWIRNLAEATPKKPGTMTKAKLRMLGGKALA